MFVPNLNHLAKRYDYGFKEYNPFITGYMVPPKLEFDPVLMGFLSKFTQRKNMNIKHGTTLQYISPLVMFSGCFII